MPHLHTSARHSGLPAKKMEKRVDRLLNFVKARVSPISQLSATIALEHFTAIMADRLLRKPDLIAGADARLTALWRWHALEETEHKAVAFDVYRTVMGKNVRAYVVRTGGLIAATVIFLGFVYAYQRELVNADKTMGRWQGFGNYMKFLLGKSGFVRDLVGPWLDYFKPGFHPWDHDNRHFLDEIDSLVEELRSYDLAAA